MPLPPRGRACVLGPHVHVHMKRTALGTFPNRRSCGEARGAAQPALLLASSRTLGQLLIAGPGSCSKIQIVYSQGF